MKSNFKLAITSFAITIGSASAFAMSPEAVLMKDINLIVKITE